MGYDPVKEFSLNQAAREIMRDRYNNSKYEYEKIVGKRTRTGELKLKRLKPLHREMIAMHLTGNSNRDIAFYLNVDEITVSRVLRDPMAQLVINQHAEGVDAEMRALNPLAVDALRRGLLSSDDKIALNATDKLLRALGKYHHESEGDKAQKETAEDVIARAMLAVQEQAGAIKELAKDRRPKAIDVEFSRAEPELLENGVSDGGNSDSS